MSDQKGKTGKSRGFSLFDLTSDKFQHELLEKALELAEAGGLDQEEAMERALASVDNLTKDKVLAYATRIQQWEAEAEALKADEERQAKRRKARENMVKRLEQRLVELLPHDQTWEDTRAKVSFRGYPVVEVLDADKVPEQYKVTETKTVTVLDVVALKRALKAGPVEGAVLKENWKVQIK